MSRRSRRRREVRRRGKQHGEERQEVSSSAGEAEPAESAEQKREDRVQAAVEARHGRAARKRAKRRGGAWDRVRRMRVSPWLIATPVVGTVVVVLAVLILTSGSSGSTGGGSAATPTPDPRVAGLTPATSIDLEVNDVNFSRTELSGTAGEAIELVVTNTGTISHNLTVAGPDDEYDTDDDFTTVPFAIKAGETARLVLKIDDPATYRFRCAFHPNIEFGTLTLE